MSEEAVISQTNQAEVTCPSCAAHLVYAPGSGNLKCEFCGTTFAIAESGEEIAELDYQEFLEKLGDQELMETVRTIRCQGCGAHVNFAANIVSDRCPFCASVLVVKQAEDEQQIKARSLLPFAVDLAGALEAFRKWIAKLWFAPGALKKRALSTETFKGIYLPYWTYDAQGYSKYRGQRGENYSTVESYTATEGGRQVTKTRNVTKVRWTNVSGEFEKFFDDVLVLGSKSVPENQAAGLAPWDLDKLVPFGEKYLSGFLTETYQVDLKSGFVKAQKIMEQMAANEAKSRIGGDQQRLNSISTIFSDITFKHILLPVWISAFRFQGKVYRFLVNGRNGKIRGQRPYSVWKILLAVLAGILTLIGLLYMIEFLGVGS